MSSTSAIEKNVIINPLYLPFITTVTKYNRVANLEKFTCHFLETSIILKKDLDIIYYY